MIDLKKTIQTTSLIVAILVVSAMIFLRLILKNSNENLKRDFKNTEIKGRIIKTFSDYSNKGLFTVVIVCDGDTNEYSDLYVQNPESVFITGDSVFKPKGVIEYYIFRNDSLITTEKGRE